MAKTEKRNEFRKHKPSGHPAYIYEKVGNEYKFLGITHSNKNGKNIELEQNPEPHKQETAYIKSEYETAITKKFKDRYKGWKFSKNDKVIVNNIIKNNKKRERK